MICFPNAKINLGLNVLRKRADGYHDIETVFYPVALKDALEITPADKTSFVQAGGSLGISSENNLVMKAYELLRSEYDLPPMQICLLKRIPVGAGLGGGSSDAAFMLKLLNDYCDLQIPDEHLTKMAVKLGADCAFFIENKPVFASGKGDVLEPVNVSLAGYHICLVKPDVPVSTAEAYAGIIPHPAKIPLRTLLQLHVSDWKQWMVNDFEQNIYMHYPRIGKIKTELYREGAVFASLSGSGSAVYGIFKEPTDLAEQFPDCFVWEGEAVS